MLAMPSTPLAAHPSVTLHPVGDPGRAEVEDFVAAVFRARYGAELRQFAPMLAARRDAEGVPVAAAGWRAADAGPLFLEQYLSRPVEDLLGAPRRRIVEVGHLAAAQAGEGRRLILQLGPLLAAAGADWVVSTVTEELRLLFLRLGIAPLALGVADPARLGAAAAAWGRYYDHQPVVLAGAVGPALQALARRRGSR